MGRGFSAGRIGHREAGTRTTQPASPHGLAQLGAQLVTGVFIIHLVSSLDEALAHTN